LNKTMRTAAQTAVLMAILTLIAKAFGFVREMVMANFFGTTYITDAYVMAFAIPMIIFGGIFASVATGYMPLFSRITENDGETAGSKFTSEVINLLMVVSILAAIIGIIFSDQIVSIFASGFSGETARLTSFFTKVTFCYILFTSIAGILEAYLQYKGTFLVQIVLGYIPNVIVIAVIVISAFTSHYYLAFGWLLAHIVRASILVFIAKKKGFKYSPVFKINETIKRIIAIALPVFIASGIMQINTFVDKTLASGLAEGSVAALNYGMILVGLITGLTISILTTILYPKLNQANSLQDYDRFSDIIGTGMTLVAIVAIPCSLGAMVYSGQIVQIIYERGVFDPLATSMTGSAFFYYSMGLLFISLNDLMIRAYYSMHDMRTPMIFAGIGVIINITLNLILIQFMGLSGLALATSIAAMANAGMLFIGMKKKYPHVILMKSKKKLLKITVAALVAVGSSYLVYIFVVMPMADIIYMRVVQLGIPVAVAILVYFGLLVVFKVEELKMIREIVKR